jgi:hypothetical protein
VYAPQPELGPDVSHASAARGPKARPVTIRAVYLSAKVCPPFVTSVRPAVVKCASTQNSDCCAERDLKRTVSLGLPEAVLSAMFEQLCCKRHPRGPTASITAIDGP